MSRKTKVSRSLRKGLSGVKKTNPKVIRKTKTPKNILQNQRNKLTRKKTELAIKYADLQRSVNSNNVSDDNSTLTKQNKKKKNSKLQLKLRCFILKKQTY